MRNVTIVVQFVFKNPQTRAANARIFLTQVVPVQNKLVMEQLYVSLKLKVLRLR